MRTLRSRMASRAARHCAARRRYGAARDVRISIGLCSPSSDKPAGIMPAGHWSATLRDRFISLDIWSTLKLAGRWLGGYSLKSAGRRHPPNAVLEQVGVLGEPVVILVRHDVGALHRVHAQVEHLRRPQARERIAQTSKPPGSRCSQNTLPSS